VEHPHQGRNVSGTHHGPTGLSAADRHVRVTPQPLSNSLSPLLMPAHPERGVCVAEGHFLRGEVPTGDTPRRSLAIPAHIDVENGLGDVRQYSVCPQCFPSLLIARGKVSAKLATFERGQPPIMAMRGLAGSRMIYLLRFRSGTDWLRRAP
jgi:hypothetical protein